jgi:hypothetical protein
MASDGFVMTREDQAAWQRPHHAVACFLIGADGRIRWARIDPVDSSYTQSRGVAITDLTCS